MLSQFFSEIVDVGFTANMEEKLDDVEEKGTEWKKIVRDYYKILEEELEKADKEIPKTEQETILTGEVCELCGKPMALKHGRYGDFIACTGYPQCKNTKPIVNKVEDVKCPACGGDIVVKRSRKGKIFYGCSNYPECTQVFWNKPVNKKCPNCGSLLVEKGGRGSKLACSNKECDYKE